MYLKNSIFIVTIVLFSFTNQATFAQTKPKTTKETKAEEKKVIITSKPYSDADFDTVVVDDLKPETENNVNQIYVAPEVRAEYHGGTDAFFKYIFDLYQSPTKEEVKTKAFVSFVVEKDGNLSNIKLVRDPGYGIGKEILRIIKTSPKWKPAMQNGQAVRSVYNIPIAIEPN